MTDLPYTPESLADRWQCHPSTIRKMIGRGELPYFRVSGTLLRIPARVVREIEQCGDLDDTETSGPLLAEPDQAESVVRLARIERTPSGSSTA